MHITSTFNLWHQEWLNRDKVEFDGETRRIYVHPGVETLILRNHLYSAWKRWVVLQKNSGFLQAMRVIGGDTVGVGQRAGDIFFLMNGWQIVVEKPINIDGILYHDDPGVSPYIVRPGGGVIATVSSLTQLIEVPVNIVTGDVGALTANIDSVPSRVWNTSANALTETGSVGEMFHHMRNDVADAKAASESVDQRVVEQLEQVAEIQTDVTSVLSNLGAVTDLLNTLLKYDTNRTQIDKNAKTMTVFDDDGVTPLRVFDLKDFAGIPSITEIAERAPR
jgi:hypothetical protein